eukprot:365122-Chlamydomonas_euryale.AAC.18
MRWDGPAVRVTKSGRVRCKVETTQGGAPCVCQLMQKFKVIGSSQHHQTVHLRQMVCRSSRSSAGGVELTEAAMRYTTPGGRLCSTRHQEEAMLAAWLYVLSVWGACSIPPPCSRKMHCTHGVHLTCSPHTGKQ